MEPLLRGWFAVVDRLLPTVAVSPLGDGVHAPGWRVILYGGDAVGRAREIPVRAQIEIDDALRPVEQRVLRDAMELFAIALRIDGAAFMDAMARGVPWIHDAWTYEPFAPDEELKLQITADLRTAQTDLYSTFVAPKGSDDPKHSDRFNKTKNALLRLAGLRDDGFTAPKLELLVQLEVVPGPHNPTALVALLRRIDREVFHVSKIVVVLSPEAEPASLPELFRVLHTFRDTALVDINIDVPVASDDRTRLARWKWFYDLAVRQAYRTINEQDAKPWGFTGIFGEPSLGRVDGAAGTATSAACLSALAHAGDHVASASICMALQDAHSDRSVRIKSLGYLLRTGRVPYLIVKDQYLTSQDVDLLLHIYAQPTREACLQALYEPAWHGKKARTLDDKTATKVLANPNEVVGVVRDFGNDREATVDVYLAGYGQCGVKRALLPAVQAMAEASASQPMPKRRLQSLDLLFLSGRDTVPSIVRLVTGVGRELTKLQLEIEDGAYTVRKLLTILEACPTLRRFIIKPLRIGQRDDEATFPPPAPREPLQELTVELTARFMESAGLAGLCRLLGGYTSELKEFVLFAEQRVLADRAIAPFVDAFFMERLPMLRKLRVIGFNSGYLRGLWDRDRASLRQLEVLMLESVSWDDEDWIDFLDALADPTHPLAQSLHTLHLKLTGWERLTLIHAALEANPFLVNIAIDVTQGVGDRPEFMRLAKATNGRRVSRLNGKLSVRHKAAFLSAINATTLTTNLPAIETQNLVSIFDYAASAETRYVRLHLVSAQAPAQAPPMF